MWLFVFYIILIEFKQALGLCTHKACLKYLT